MRHLLLLALCLFQLSRGVHAAEQKSPPAPPPDDDTRRTVGAANGFSLDLYRELAAAEQGNLCVSGYSAYAVLSLVVPGARDDAAATLRKTLHIPAQQELSEHLRHLGLLEERLLPPSGPEAEQVRRRLQALERELQEIQSSDRAAEQVGRQQELVSQINPLRQQIDPYELRFANALWCERQFPLASDYQATVRAHPRLRAELVDFAGAAEQARQQINDWAATRTNDRIRELIAQGMVDAQTRLVLTNAVHFNGKWKQPFETSQTRPGEFTLADRTTVQTPLMNNYVRSARYVDLRPDGSVNDFIQVEADPSSRFDLEWTLPDNPDGLKALELDYRGGTMSMLFLLPARPDGLSQLERELTDEKLRAIISKLDQHTVGVTLPRFTTRSSLQLNAPLRKLGLDPLFKAGSLSEISDHPDAETLGVSLVIQQTFLELTEEGTEAAAVTAVFAPTAAAPPASAPKPNPEFRARHPFLYFIRHRESGTILFVGRMVKPE